MSKIASRAGLPAVFGTGGWLAGAAFTPKSTAEVIAMAVAFGVATLANGGAKIAASFFRYRSPNAEAKTNAKTVREHVKIRKEILRREMDAGGADPKELLRQLDTDPALPPNARLPDQILGQQLNPSSSKSMPRDPDSGPGGGKVLPFPGPDQDPPVGLPPA